MDISDSRETQSNGISPSNFSSSKDLIKQNISFCFSDHLLLNEIITVLKKIKFEYNCSTKHLNCDAIVSLN